jgi:four helix bundle protein
MRRAAVSVVSNIAEGQGRLTSGEFLHFLGQARGSLLELDTQLSIALDLAYLDQGEQASWLRRVTKSFGLLNCLIDSLRRKRMTPL